MSRMRHLLWRSGTHEFSSLCSIDIHDKSCVMQMLHVVKFVPNAASASEADAIAWLLSKPSHLSTLAKAVSYDLPSNPTKADVAS
jgi:hypothetical protein